MNNIQKLLVQNTFWRGLYYITSFALNVAIARHFLPAMSGMIYYLINLFAFITLILSLSLEASVVYYASKDEIGKSKLFTFCFLWLAFGVISLLISFFILKRIIPESLYIANFKYALIFITGNIFTSLMSSFFYADKKFKAPNIIGIALNIILIVLILFINAREVLTDEKFINIYFLSFLLQGFLLAFLLIKNDIGYLNFVIPDNSDLKKIFAFSLLVFSSNILTFLCYRVDYWFVYNFCTAKELGEYIQVSKIVQMFFVLPSILATVVFPLTAGGEKQQINEMLAALTRVILMIYTAACIILALSGKWLFPFIFGEAFSGMYIPFLFYIPGILSLSTLYAFTAYYSGKGRAVVNMKGVSLALIVIILGDAFFIPEYGIKAAAAVSSAGYIIYHIYVLRVFIKEYKTGLSNFFVFRFSDITKMKNLIIKN